jgi:hypothetical protein
MLIVLLVHCTTGCHKDLYGRCFRMASIFTCPWWEHRCYLYLFIHSFMELSSPFKELCQPNTGFFCRWQPNITIYNDATVCLHRLYSYTCKFTLPFPVPTYILLSLFFHLHLAYVVDAVFLICIRAINNDVSLFEEVLIVNGREVSDR